MLDLSNKYFDYCLQFSIIPFEAKEVSLLSRGPSKVKGQRPLGGDSRIAPSARPSGWTGIARLPGPPTSFSASGPSEGADPPGGGGRRGPAGHRARAGRRPPRGVRGSPMAVSLGHLRGAMEEGRPLVLVTCRRQGHHAPGGGKSSLCPDRSLGCIAGARENKI